MKPLTYCASAVVILIFASTLSTQAGVITAYGDYEAATIVYTGVAEDMTTGTYGAPTVSVDALNFNPLGVEAKTTDAGGSVITDAQLQFGVEAKAGKAIAGLDFSELGDYTMTGFGGAYVDVTAEFFVTISEVDGIAITPFTTANSMTFSPNAAGTFTHSGSIILPETEGVWSGAIYLDVLSMLTAEGISYNPEGGGVTKMFVNLDNKLKAISEAGTSALIKKKDFTGFTVTTDVIPEPASVVLILGTTCSLAFIRRRIIG